MDDSYKEKMNVDATSFSNDSYARKIEKPWGWEIHWTPDDKPYMGKVLHVNAGARLSLQAHDVKVESWFLSNGRAMVVWDNADGELVETELVMGQGYSCVVGQRHRLVGITDCDIIEVSTPELGTTFRVEDDYKRKDETEAAREQRNQEDVLE